jgi:hypothetical protein
VASLTSFLTQAFPSRIDTAHKNLMKDAAKVRVRGVRNADGATVSRIMVQQSSLHVELLVDEAEHRKKAASVKVRAVQ